jgi:transcriptional regulator with XRE-family HTH domain
MDALRFGRFVRVVRLRIGLRQRDVADRAGTGRSTTWRIEHGRLDEVTWSAIKRICDVLEIRLELIPSWRGFEGARLLDREHAATVELLVRDLTDLGWETIVEFSFNHYGDRGSVDIVAWHPGARALLLIEVKTAIVDVQDLLGAMDRKARVVPRLIALERGWVPRSVSRLLVVKESRAARTMIAQHRATFASALPDRTIASRRWLRQPVGRLAGVMFLADARLAGLMRRKGGAVRVHRAHDPTSPHDPAAPPARGGREASSKA